MWLFSQTSGDFTDASGFVIAQGYAGNGEGKNNPEMQNVHDVGPLPRGFYTMTELIDSPKTGPDTIVLVPDPENEMFGRADFRIHGDSIQEPGSASDGCIVQPRFARMRAWESLDHRLEVTG
jgi:hypothetical protein